MIEKMKMFGENNYNSNNKYKSKKKKIEIFFFEWLVCEPTLLALSLSTRRSLSPSTLVILQISIEILT